MDELTVYQDYVQTMSFLRASRNRVVNSISTSTMRPADAEACRRLSGKMYDMHVLLGLQVVKKLQAAMQSKHVPRATELHRHNRQTARLSRLFEEDVSDYHVDPDADYNPDVPAKPVDAAKPIECQKFLTKLSKMYEEMKGALKQLQARQPGTPKAPQ